MPPLPANQHEIVTRLAAGDRITGPREVIRSNRSGSWRELRSWTWRDGRAVHSASVNAVLVKGLARVLPTTGGENEVVLVSRP